MNKNSQFIAFAIIGLLTSVTFTFQIRPLKLDSSKIKSTNKDLILGESKCGAGKVNLKVTNSIFGDNANTTMCITNDTLNCKTSQDLVGCTSCKDGYYKVKKDEITIKTLLGDFKSKDVEICNSKAVRWAIYAAIAAIIIGIGFGIWCCVTGRCCCQRKPQTIVYANGGNYQSQPQQPAPGQYQPPAQNNPNQQPNYGF